MFRWAYPQDVEDTTSHIGRQMSFSFAMSMSHSCRRLWDKVTAEEIWIPYARRIVEVLSPSNRRSTVERHRAITLNTERNNSGLWPVQKTVNLSIGSMVEVPFPISTFIAHPFEDTLKPAKPSFRRS